MCPECREKTRVYNTIPQNPTPGDNHRFYLSIPEGIVRQRRCAQGHTFRTVEVPQALYDEISP